MYCGVPTSEDRKVCESTESQGDQWQVRRTNFGKTKVCNLDFSSAVLVRLRQEQVLSSALVRKEPYFRLEVSMRHIVEVLDSLVYSVKSSNIQ